MCKYFYNFINSLLCSDEHQSGDCVYSDFEFEDTKKYGTGYWLPYPLKFSKKFMVLFYRENGYPMLEIYGSAADMRKAAKVLRYYGHTPLYDMPIICRNKRMYSLSTDSRGYYIISKQEV